MIINLREFGPWCFTAKLWNLVRHGHTKTFKLNNFDQNYPTWHVVSEHVVLYDNRKYQILFVLFHLHSVHVSLCKCSYLKYTERSLIDSDTWKIGQNLNDFWINVSYSPHYPRQKTKKSKVPKIR